MGGSSPIKSSCGEKMHALIRYFLPQYHHTCPYSAASLLPPLQCSATCDGGISERAVECVELRHYRNENGTVMENITVVDEADCDLNDRPTATRPCNTHRCFYQWHTGRFGSVS